jgi:hypothetical protein
MFIMTSAGRGMGRYVRGKPTHRRPKLAAIGAGVAAIRKVTVVKTKLFGNRFSYSYPLIFTGRKNYRRTEEDAR